MPYKTGPKICGMLILALAFAAQAAAFEQRVPARVKKVIDGDTVKVEARPVAGHHRAEQRAGARRRHARDSEC